MPVSPGVVTQKVLGLWIIDFCLGVSPCPMMWPSASPPHGLAAQLWARAECPVAQHTAAGLVGGQAREQSLGENWDCHPGLAPCLWFLLPLLHQILPFVQHWSTRFEALGRAHRLTTKWCLGGMFSFQNISFLPTINLRKGMATSLPGGVQRADPCALGSAWDHCYTFAHLFFPWFSSTFHRSTVHLDTVPVLCSHTLCTQPLSLQVLVMPQTVFTQLPGL